MIDLKAKQKILRVDNLFMKTPEYTAPQTINNGDKVSINTKVIKGRHNFDSMSDEYKQFIDENEETIFTAKVERTTLISLEENPKWLFWSGDLIIKDKE